MHDLQISIKGEITSSNFEEWKNTILQRIDATSTELVTDEDFASADGTVKSYKLIEKRLDEVKQSALDQSKDITDLFDAIDSVKSRVREVRLTLYRQVNQKKKEIRLDLIDAAISKVRSCIKEKTGVFPLLDHSDLLDDFDYQSAIKGKSSLLRAQTALKQLVANKLKDVEQRLVQVQVNEAQLNQVTNEYGFLFHDKKSLLLKPNDKLIQLIQARISDYKEKEARKENPNNSPAPPTTPSPIAPHPVSTDPTQQEPTYEPVAGFVSDLKQLASGLNPTNGTRFASSSIVNHVDTVRLIYKIIEEIEHQSAQQ